LTWKNKKPGAKDPDRHMPMQELKRKIFIFGASGHAKVIIDMVERQGLHEIEFLVDDDEALAESSVKGYRVIGGRRELLVFALDHGPPKGVVAIGCNQARRMVAHWLAKRGFEFATAVHPGATIGRDVRVQPGAVIMAGGVVNVDSIIGEHAIINTGTTVDHDCRIGAFCHIAPGAHLCGTVTVGSNSLIGAGTTVIPNLSIGRNVVVGAGSTVIKDVPDNVTVLGNPARVVSRQEINPESIFPLHP
jgi:sugar O-acyltransferase (sialic acid O-acetyltransferase NeuD family)